MDSNKPNDENAENNNSVFDSLFSVQSDEECVPFGEDLEGKFVFPLKFEDMDSLNIGVLVYNSEAKIIYINQEVARLTESEDIDVRGMDLLSFYNSLKVRDLYSNESPEYEMQKLLTTGINRYTHVKAFHKITTNSGITRILETMLIPMKVSDNKYNFAMIVNDTSRVYDVAPTSNEVSKFYKILSFSPIAIVLIDYDTMTVFDCNESYSKMTGFDRDEVVGQKIETMSFWVNDSEKYYFLESLSKGEEIVNLKNIIQGKGYKEIICELSSSVNKIDDRRIIILYLVDITSKVEEEVRKVELLNSFEDIIFERNIELDTINKDLLDQISTREQSEIRLEESTRKYSSLVNQLPVGVYKMDPNGNYLECNPAFLSISGFSSIEDIWENLKTKIIFNSLQINQLDISKADTVNLEPAELAIKKKDSTDIWVQNFARISTNGKEIVSIDGVIIDITQNKIAENALMQSELKYRALFENMNDIYLSFDLEGIVTNISPSFGRMTGLNAENMLNKHFTILLNNDIINKELITSFYSVTTSKFFVIAFKNFLTSSPLYHSINLQATYNQFREITGYEGIARDVTKELEHFNTINTLFDISAAINETETLDELYAKIHNSIGKVIFANNFFIALVDKTMNHLTFPYFKDELDNKYNDTIAVTNENSLVAKVIREKKPFLFRCDHNVKDSKTQYIGSMSLSWLGVPLKLKGEVIGALVVQSYTNIDQYDDSHIKFLQSVSDQIAVAIDRKNSQIDLDSQYSLMSNLIDNIPNPIYFMGVHDNKFKLVNDAFTKLFNKTKYEIIDRSSHDLFKDDVLERHQHYKKEINLTKQNQRFEETLIVNGEERYFLTMMNCVFDAENELDGIIGIFMDITEQKKANIATEESLKKEKEVNNIKTQFVSMVSHEFKTPLQSILLSVDLLQEYSDKLTSEDKIKQYNRIRDTISSLNVLLNDVLLINRSERGQTQFTPEKMDLSEYISKLVNDLKFVNYNNVNVILNMNCDSQTVNADERLLQLILTNLINNAIKYSCVDGEVRITAEIYPEYANFEIADNGIGIPEKDQERLFTPFHRSSNVGKIAGTGLGLSIVKDSVVKHGGTITCISKENEGTTFKVRIPFEN